MVTCPGCGQSMRFDPGKGLLVCDYCDTTLDPNQATGDVFAESHPDDTAFAAAEESLAQAPATFSGTLFTCPQCGGEIFSDSDTAVTFCSYCGVSVELESRTVQMMAPSAVIPFKLTKDQVKEAYKKFIGKALFAPNYMKEEGQLDKLRGIYMPYWVYETEYEGPVSLKGKKSYRRGDYIITDHYSLNTSMYINYKGTAFDASSSFSDVYSEAIAPFNVKASVEFSNTYLSGFYADTADVKSEVYNQECKDVVGADVGGGMAKMYSEIGKYNVTDAGSTVSQLLDVKDAKMAYFPVWFMSVRHNGRISYAVINGESGKVAADVPIDFKKYLIGSLITAVPIALILNFLVTPTPSMVNIIGIIFAIIGFVICNNKMNLIYTRQFGFDDKGLMSTRDITVPVQQPANNQKQVKTAKSGGLAGIGSTLITVGIILMYVGIEMEYVGLLLGGFITLIVAVVLLATGSTTTNPKNAIKTNKSVVFKKPMGEKMGTLWKPLAAIIIGSLLLIINPFRDIVYYGGVLIMAVFVLLSLFDIVRLHNELTTHLPRQFNKRGGDE